MIGRYPGAAVTKTIAQTQAPPAPRVAVSSRDPAILLAVLAAITLGIGLYLWRPAALFAQLPYALFASCPVSMWLMMRSMNSSNDTKGQN